MIWPSAISGRIQDLQGPRIVFEGSAAHAGLTLNKVAINGEILLVGVKKGHREQEAV